MPSLLGFLGSVALRAVAREMFSAARTGAGDSSSEQHLDIPATSRIECPKCGERTLSVTRSPLNWDFYSCSSCGYEDRKPAQSNELEAPEILRPYKPPFPETIPSGPVPDSTPAERLVQWIERSPYIAGVIGSFGVMTLVSLLLLVGFRVIQFRGVMVIPFIMFAGLIVVFLGILGLLALYDLRQLAWGILAGFIFNLAPRAFLEWGCGNYVLGYIPVAPLVPFYMLPLFGCNFFVLGPLPW